MAKIQDVQNKNQDKHEIQTEEEPQVIIVGSQKKRKSFTNASVAFEKKSLHLTICKEH